VSEFRRWVNIYSIVSVLYMGLVFYLSSYPVQMRVPSFSSFDKLSHIGAYGILACLVYLGLWKMNVATRHLLALSFLISFLFGISNEIHQYFIPCRTAEILDVVANGIGAFCFPLVFRLRTLHRGK